MSLYELLLWLHVTCAVLWVGGGVMLTILSEMARRSRSEAEVATLLRYVSVLGLRMQAPLAGITGALGITMVLALDAFTFRSAWVGISLALWIASSALGGAYLSPREKRLIEGIGTANQLPPGLRGTADQVLTAARVESAVLLLIVFLMTVKPGT